MAIESTLQLFSCYPAGADLRNSQFTFVKIAGDLIVPCGAGEHAAGVLQNTPNTGEAAMVAFSGISKVKIGATDVAQDAQVASLANGLIGTAASGNVILGQLINAGTKTAIGTMFIQYQGAKA